MRLTRLPPLAGLPVLPGFALLLALAGCTGASEDGKETGDADADTDADTDTDTDADQDRDGDGYTADVDCDESRADVNPGVSSDICNERDDDCDGAVDEDPDLSWYLDADRDGFGETDATPFVACDPGSESYASNRGDCDDDDERVYPGASEPCDGRDNDCDGQVDDDVEGFGLWYPDLDDDGYGDADATALETCDPGPGYVLDASDCNDRDADISPEGFEACDDRDNDCDGQTDENELEWQAFYEDADGDGAGSEVVVYGCDEEQAGGVSNSLDCDDTNANEPVFVATTGSSRGRGTIDSPLDSIQSAIDVATVCVRVSDGTYYEDIDFGGNAVDVSSLNGSSATTIYGTGGDSVVKMVNYEGTTTALRGFTITGGSGYPTSSSSWDGSSTYYYYYYTYGGGLYLIYASPTLEDLVIVNNYVYDYGYSTYYSGSYTYYYSYQGYGGGIYNYGGSPTLIDVDIRENEGYLGAAIYDLYGSMTGTRVRIQENAAGYYTHYLYQATETWENLIVNGDTSEYGYSGIYADYSTLNLRNTTVVSVDYGVYGYSSTVGVNSSILTGVTYGIYDASRGSGSWNIRYSDVWGNSVNYSNVTDPTGTSGNVTVNPGFTSYTDDADADSDDLSLRATSTLIDAGNPDAAYDDPDGSRNDMGAFGGPNGGW